MGRHKSHGFTIVELLIVIIVIAILAAITIVAFNGIQQRAKNAAKISTVASLAKLISLYRTENTTYPMTTSGNWCLTADNQCRNYDGSTISGSNATLLSALKLYGNVPSSANDNISGSYYGITYMYSTVRTLNGVLNPFILLFWLDGTNQSCTGIAGMVSVGDSGVTNDMTQKPQAKADTGTGQTRCYLMFAS